MEASAISGLAGLGAAGAVILAMFYYLQHEARRDKLRAEGDQKILDRIDKIVDRHLASEELNRQQIKTLSESNRELFDRVINICLDLSNSIRELTSGARANEKAITELRAELRSLAGPAQPKALGHEEPRPFGSG
jgi:DNA replication initiation complex subunit (GINS family)